MFGLPQEANRDAVSKSIQILRLIAITELGHDEEETTRYITGQVLRVDGGQTVTGNIESMKEDFQ